MNERTSWISHAGKRILFSDYSGLHGNDMIDVIAASERAVLSSGAGTVLMINDVSDSYMNKETTERTRALIDHAKANGVETRIALVGVSGLQKIIASAIEKEMYFASNLDDAKQWLVK